VTAIKSQHSRLFEQLIEEERGKLVEAIITTTSPERWLFETIGMIRGLDAALKISELADFKLSGDDE
jgi:hypothetical protein